MPSGQEAFQFVSHPLFPPNERYHQPCVEGTSRGNPKATRKNGRTNKRHARCSLLKRNPVQRVVGDAMIRPRIVCHVSDEHGKSVWVLMHVPPDGVSRSFLTGSFWGGGIFAYTVLIHIIERLILV